MKQMKQQFVDSWHELRHLKTVVVTAMLIAVGIILGYFSITVTPYLRIGFSFIANELTALLFGPGGRWCHGRNCRYYQISHQARRVHIFLDLH